MKYSSSKYAEHVNIKLTSVFNVIRTIYYSSFMNRIRLLLCMCVFLAVYNKPQSQRISNREFKLWTFLQGTEFRVVTFHAETCVISHQSISPNNSG